MAKKAKVQFECQSCGYVSPKYLGRCPNCGQWNSMVEEVIQDTSDRRARVSLTGKKTQPQRLSEVVPKKEPRVKTELVELNRVLGALAGAMAAAVPGLLRAFFGTSEVIVTIMMNYILLYVSTFALHEVMPESYRSSLDSSNMISQNASLRLPWLTQAFGGSRVNSGLFLAIIALIFVWLLMKKTTLGFEIRSVGLNPFASEYAGMSSKRTIVLSMVISGALAGLGGVVEGLGTYQNFFVQTTSLSIGFDGMAVSLLGSGSAIGILLSAILFSILKIGGLGMQTGAGVPFEIVNVSIALIIFFVGINFLIRFVMAKVFQGKKQEEIVATIESKPTNQNHEGGEL